jgi:hypothetical protein
MQGIRVPSILFVQVGDEHARLRKEFNVFFNTDNINAVISKLIAEVLTVCSDVSETAAKAPGGVASVEVTAHASSIINTVVRKVWSPSVGHMQTVYHVLVAKHPGKGCLDCTQLRRVISHVLSMAVFTSARISNHSLTTKAMSQALWESIRQHAGLL